MKFWTWSAWELDHVTWGWIGWLLFFIVWEFYSLKWHPGQELTAHARPVFLAYPVLWWISLGAWLWVGIHFLAPAWERSFLRLLGGE